MNHSPAPWETSRDAVPAGHVQVTVYDANGNRVATVFENEGNVALVKAAPDMLEALQECRAEIRRLNVAAGETVFNPAATELADAAIRNAEGN